MKCDKKRRMNEVWSGGIISTLRLNTTTDFMEERVVRGRGGRKSLNGNRKRTGTAAGECHRSRTSFLKMSKSNNFLLFLNEKIKNPLAGDGMLFCSRDQPRYTVFESKTGLAPSFGTFALWCSWVRYWRVRYWGERQSQKREKIVRACKKKEICRSKQADSSETLYWGVFRIQEHEGIEIDIRKTNRGLKSEGKWVWK